VTLGNYLRGLEWCKKELHAAGVGWPKPRLHRPLTPMKTATGTTLVSNGQLIDGTGKPAIPMAHSSCAMATSSMPAPQRRACRAPVATRIDARGWHNHAGARRGEFPRHLFQYRRAGGLDIKYPVEYVSLPPR